MTAGQKKNIDRLKKLQADAKKLKKANPKLTHIEAIRMAAGKKLGAYVVEEKNENFRDSDRKNNLKVLKQKRLSNGTFDGYIYKNAVKKVSGIKKRKATPKITERTVLSQAHKVKAAANKLDELQHEHMLQKSIGKMAESFLAVYSSNGKTIIQRFKTTSLMEAKKLASAFKKMHNLKGTLKVSKFSHI
jgi:hypothetical protein